MYSLVTEMKHRADQLMIKLVLLSANQFQISQFVHIIRPEEFMYSTCCKMNTHKNHYILLKMRVNKTCIKWCYIIAYNLMNCTYTVRKTVAQLLHKINSCCLINHEKYNYIVQ